MLLYLTAYSVYGQRPFITRVEPLDAYTQSSILITGGGFGSNVSSHQVWFDQAKGTITRATDFSLEVIVPPQARLHNIEVINTASRLSAKSTLKATPSFSVEGFDPTKLAAPLSFPSINATFDVCTCDLTNDNKPEVIGTKFENAASDIVILHNQSAPGNLAFNAIDKTKLGVLNLKAPTGHITCGDLNGDGRPDLVASRSGTTANSIFILQNISTTTPNFNAPVELLLEAGHFARQVTIHDLNGDGKPEIIVANSFNNVLYVFVNQSTGGALTMSPTPIKIVMAGVPNSLALEVQDMDGDQKPDIVMTQNQGSSIYLLKNLTSGTITFSGPTTVTIPGGFNDMNTADFNKDDKLDLVITSVFTAQVLVLLNQSTTSNFSFSAPIMLASGIGPFGVDVSDIDGNGFSDIIVANRGVAAIDVFLHNKNLAAPGFSRVVVPTNKPNWFVKAGDLDGDGKADLAFSSFNTAASNFSIDILRNTNCHLPLIINETPTSICAGQTITLNALAAPAVTFDWKNNGTSIKNGADNFVTINGAGSYTVTATGESGSCVVVSQPFVVSAGLGTAPASPVINAITPACAGQTLTITTPAIAGATYLWRGPENFAASETDPMLTIPNVTSKQTGLYTLRVKVGDCTSAADTEEAQVVNLTDFTVSNNKAGPLCQGQSAVLSVTSMGGYTYQWIRNGADIIGQTANTLTATLGGTYRLRVTAAGCSNETADQTIKVVTPPVASFSAETSACIGNLLTFTNSSTVDANAVAVYAWNFGDGNTASTFEASHAYSSAQKFTPSLAVSYEGVSGCTNSDNVSVTINAAVIPQITSTTTEICPGDVTPLTVTGDYSAINWNTGETGSVITVTQPGSYTIETQDATGCTGVAEISIGLKPGCGSVTIAIPNMFSPNGDFRNDRWVIPEVDKYLECTMNIFDDKGVSVFKQKGYPIEGWDGSYNGKLLPDGVYYYLFACPSGRPLTGSVLIIR
ncbi:MAG: FG-GAP-like repeat-containing protein [Chryseolinea sp.]